MDVLPYSGRWDFGLFGALSCGYGNSVTAGPMHSSPSMGFVRTLFPYLNLRYLVSSSINNQMYPVMTKFALKKKRQWKNEKAMWWYKGVELLWIFKLMAKLAVLDLIAQVLYRHEDHNSGFKLKLGYCTQKEATEEKDYMS